MRYPFPSTRGREGGSCVSGNVRGGWVIGRLLQCWMGGLGLRLYRFLLLLVLVGSTNAAMCVENAWELLEVCIIWSRLRGGRMPREARMLNFFRLWRSDSGSIARIESDGCWICLFFFWLPPKLLVSKPPPFTKLDTRDTPCITSDEESSYVWEDAATAAVFIGETNEVGVEATETWMWD